MIKRLFYREEHGNEDDVSWDSSSSSSSSDSEVEAEQATEESQNNGAAVEAEENDDSCSTSSGYESEDSSGNEIDADSSGFVKEDDETGNHAHIPVGPQLSSKYGAAILKKEFNGTADKEAAPDDMPSCILKCKSVYRCRICPRIVCLNEESIRAHLNSKRHARSEKLLKENRLKAMLNSDGEIENQETPTEMHARIVALVEDKSKKKNKGRQRQRKRSRKKNVADDGNTTKAREATKFPAKKRRKNEN